jgi:hypothetical protein
MAKKDVVTLRMEEREKLLTLIGSGTGKARTLAHARILLKADEGWSDLEICKALNVSVPTIEQVRKQFVFEGFEASLSSKVEMRLPCPPPNVPNGRPAKMVRIVYNYD